MSEHLWMLRLSQGKREAFSPVFSRLCVEFVAKPWWWRGVVVMSDDMVSYDVATGDVNHAQVQRDWETRVPLSLITQLIISCLFFETFF